jgi:hypothetical protein
MPLVMDSLLSKPLTAPGKGTLIVIVSVSQADKIESRSDFKWKLSILNFLKM